MAKPLLSLRAIGKIYWRGPHELRVLADATLDVHAREMVAVWGKRGAGKTTLLRIAAALERPDSGHVLFEDRDLGALSETSRASLRHTEIGWVRRSGPRSELRVLDYVALPLLGQGRLREALHRAYEALVRVGVAECAEERWECISDGERALVSIAHGIVRRPKLLLVDDPTASLDSCERETVTELLRSLAVNQGMGVLMSAPDMPTMMSSHQIRTLSGGRLLAPPDHPSESRNRVMRFPTGGGRPERRAPQLIRAPQERNSRSRAGLRDRHQSPPPPILPGSFSAEKFSAD
ncbi:MAG: ATP-binding cassette domain-containing protein [Solirubrobacteraceae bacterium]